jgi:hypothetical protein
MLLVYVKQKIPPVRESISLGVETSLGQFIEALQLLCGLKLTINENQ